MVLSSQANTPDAVSVYDALGNRVAEKVNDVWQFVIYDAFGKLVAEYGGATPQDEGGVKYFMQDWQGSVRAGVNAGGYVKSRTDHQAFGEDIASGVGLRSESQGYGAPVGTRQGYGLTENDQATGLNHTWFRKNENRAGRWTSPDPYNGSASVGDPQSWNRFSYVENEPTNFVDPSGLYMSVIFHRNATCFVFYENDRPNYICFTNNWNTPDPTPGDPGIPGPSGNTGTSSDPEYEKCMNKVKEDFGSPPAVSDEEWKQYNDEMRTFRINDAITREGFDKKTRHTRFWTAVGAILGLLGCFAGPKGCVIGVGAGAAIGYLSSTDFNDIDLETYNKLAAFAKSEILRKAPNAVRREQWESARNTAVYKCRRLLNKKALPSWVPE